MGEIPGLGDALWRLCLLGAARDPSLTSPARAAPHPAGCSHHRGVPVAAWTGRAGQGPGLRERAAAKEDEWF